MNWTGGKRNKIKVKLELQKQKEFFNRQRLKKVHSFLNIEPRRTRTLTSIEVVRRNETPRNNFLSNDYFNVDKKLLLDKTCKDSIILDIDNDDPDFTKRKQFLLQDNDWAGFEFTAKSVKNLVNLQRNEGILCTANNRSHMNSPGTRPNVNHTNSLSPLTQNTTFKQFVDVESLEWHQFLTNQNDISSKTEHECQNNSPISSKKTALHCVAPEPTTASNIEWNKFMRAPDDNTTIFDSDSSESYKAIHSSLLSSARYFNYVTNGFKKNRLYLNTSNYKDSSESSAIKFSDITTNEFSKVNQDGQKNSKEPLRIGSKMTMDQEILKRIQDLELKNARLQFEINFLKKDIKWLTATIKKIKLYNKPTVRDN